MVIYKILWCARNSKKDGVVGLDTKLTQLVLGSMALCM